MQEFEDTYKRRRSRPLPLAALLPKLTRKALGKFGFSYIGLITDWATIVGPDIAQMSAPEKLTFPRNKRDSGVLRLKAEGGGSTRNSTPRAPNSRPHKYLFWLPSGNAIEYYQWPC